MQKCIQGTAVFVLMFFNYLSTILNKFVNYYSSVKTTHTKIVNGQSVTTVITKQSSANGSSTTTSETFHSSNNELTYDPDHFLRSSHSSTPTHEKPKSLFGIFRKKVPSTSDENNECLAVKNVKHFETDCLSAHNKYRKMHGAEDLKLNKAMCKYAQEWAKVSSSFVLVVLMYNGRASSSP